jgi:hypothetical protein
MIVTHDNTGMPIYENDIVYVDFYDYNIICKSKVYEIIYSSSFMCFMFCEDDRYDNLKTYEDILNSLNGMTFSLFKQKKDRDNYIIRNNYILGF